MADERQPPLFAFIALSEATVPSLEQGEAALVDSLPAGTPLGDFQVSESSNITFQVTFGPDAATRFKTRHAPSLWPRPEPVLRLEV